MLEEIVKCREDILYFADNYYKVKNVDGGIVNFRPRDYQRKVLKALVDTPNALRHFLLLAPRQTGKTTIIGCYIAWHVLFNNDKECALLSFKEAGAIEILDRIKLGIEGLPIFLQQGIVEWSKKTVKFENGSLIKAAGTSKHAISGLSLSIIYADEFSKVQPNLAEDFKNAIFPVVSSSETGRIIISSTPTGTNFFYEDWLKAKSGKSEFYPMRVPWNVAGRDEEFKQSIIRTHGIKHWEQEYNCSFIGSSCTLIDPGHLEAIQVKEPIEFRHKDCLRIYEKPIPGKYYLMGVDTALGVGRDYSVVQILKINSAKDIEQVAVYRSNTISIPNFAQRIVEISKWYNNAVIMCECNAEGSKTAHIIWNELEHDTLINISNKELGVRSTKKTKIGALIGLKEYVERGHLKLCDADTRAELLKYEESENGSFNASEGNDDTVTSLAFAIYYFYTTKVNFPGDQELDIHNIEDGNKIEENWQNLMYTQTNSFADDPEIADFLNGNF